MKLLCTILLLLNATNIYLQCPDGYLDLRTQLEVDSFKILYPRCTEFNDYIFVTDTYGDITNLDGLSNLKKITGGIQISYNLNLESLDGLLNLTQIDGSLTIFKNSPDTDYSGLSNIKYLGNLVIENHGENPIINLPKIEILGSLKVRNFSETYTIKGLEQVTNLGVMSLLGDIDFSKLENLRKVNLLTIMDNQIMHDFSGFEFLAIDTVNILSLSEIHSLSTLGIQSIKYIDRMVVNSIENLNLEMLAEANLNRLAISNCGNIENIEGLNGSTIEAIGIIEIRDLKNLGRAIMLPNLKRLALQDNLQLDDISSLNFPSAGFDYLNISGNKKLSECSIESICNVIGIDSLEIIISSNKERCKSIEQVEENCLISSANQIDEFAISIWPNPADDFLNIESAKQLEYQIFNLDSKVLKTGNTKESQIYLEEFEPGMYILQVTSKDYNNKITFIKI